MTRDDIIFYSTIASGLGGPAAIVGMIYTILFYHKSPPTSGESMNKILSAPLPKRIWLFGALSAVLYCLTIYGLISMSGKVGPQGATGPQGLTGPQGIPGVATDASGLQLRTQTLEVELANTKKIAEAMQSAKAYLKAQACFEDLSKIKADLQLGYDFTQKLIVSPQNYLNFHTLMPTITLPSVLQQANSKIEICIPKDQRSAELQITDEQLDNPAPNEPKGDIDQQRKFRRNYFRFNQAANAISGAETFLKQRVESTKGEIER